MEKIKLNEKELTQEEFQKEKEAIAKKKGVKLIEISEGVYKTRILG
ncbi:MAG: hypothetical protein PF569_02295 [Candidatus Woesearchaeota archaeon]|jgi:hypothetical protein|nr:hypothetical protein [Candidatus Woesearchaeota archaeon]